MTLKERMGKAINLLNNIKHLFMSKKLTRRVNIRALSYLKVVFFCILFSILVANCGSNGTGEGEKVDWLHHWKPILFTADAADEKKIDTIKKKIRVHVRGWLAEYNDSERTKYIVK